MAAKGGGSSRVATLNASDKALGYKLVTVDVGALDKSWSQNWGYIEKGGGSETPGSAKEGSYEFQKTQYESGKTQEAPRVHVDKNGRVEFEDGRHRFAAMRDLGDKQITVAMDKESRQNAEKHGLLTSSQSSAQSAPAKARAGRR